MTETEHLLGIACIVIPTIALCIAWVIIKIEDYFTEKRIQEISERYRKQREKAEKEHIEFMQRYAFRSRRG